MEPSHKPSDDRIAVWMNRAETAADNGDFDEASVWWTRAAEAGEPKAMLHMAALGFERSDPERGLTGRPAATWRDLGRYWLRKAADTNDPDLLYTAGGIAQEQGHDEAKALDLYRQAAEGGQTDAMNEAAIILARNGKFEEAEELFLKARDAGNYGVLRNLGLFAEERGDLDAAKSWYQAGAEAGDLVCYDYLGDLAMRLNDVEAARRWYEQGVEAGEANCMYSLALIAADDDNETRDYWLGKAAENGHPSAMLDLGMAAVDDGEEAAARDWFRKAFDAGNLEGLFQLGLLNYRTGDLGAARRQWQQAAELGHYAAMYDLAILSSEQGDTQASAELMRKAAEAGIPDAMLYLGESAAKRDVEEESIDWYCQAATWLVKNDPDFQDFGFRRQLQYGFYGADKYYSSQGREIPVDIPVGTLLKPPEAIAYPHGIQVSGGLIGMPRTDSIEDRVTYALWTVQNFCRKQDESNPNHFANRQADPDHATTAAETPTFVEIIDELQSILDNGAHISAFNKILEKLKTAAQDEYWYTAPDWPAKHKQKDRGLEDAAKQLEDLIETLSNLKEYVPDTFLRPTFYPALGEDMAHPNRIEISGPDGVTNHDKSLSRGTWGFEGGVIS